MHLLDASEWKFVKRQPRFGAVSFLDELTSQINSVSSTFCNYTSAASMILR